MNKKLVRTVIVIILLAAISAGIYYREQLDVLILQQWLDQAGVWAPVVFILIYITATVLFIPGSVITLTGGVLFGPILGTFCNITGATLGAAISFLISRYLLSDWVSQRAEGKVKQLVNGVEAEGWRFVAFVRLVPLFPFNLLNYALGLTKIRFIEYLIASYIFMLPAAFAYTYIGYVGREAISGDESLINKLLIAVALIAVVAFLPRFISSIRRGPSIDVAELKDRIEQNTTLVLDVRSANEYDQGHLQDALNIPVEQLDEQLEKEQTKLDGYLDKSISIVCRTDKRSAVAANKLLKHGFQDVRVVRGGMTDWQAAYQQHSIHSADG